MNDNKKQTIDEVVRDILDEKRKKDSMVETSLAGVGLNLNSEKVKKALLNTIKKYNNPIKKEE